MTETTAAARTTPWWRGEWASLVAMLLLLTLARTSFANHYQVPSGSMEPNLMPGDRVVVNMMAYGLRVPFTDIELYDRGEPVPGDIVVFKSPEDGTRLIKRVVAIGGQAVALHDGRLWVDGKALFDADATDVEHFGDRAVMLNLAHGGGPDIDGLVIPEGMALVLGDHRGNSQDGRFFGLVPMKSLYARAEAVYYRSGEGFGWTRL
ncbi:signal peptidase I [Lysobacter brunescens]|uniref:Signal peptidase I n=1 Tax=Lysobacter brunescens TaxID=262323 RepID=A0ABW2YDL4_9GAMM